MEVFMTKQQRFLLTLGICCFLFSIVPNLYAMHIMEGALPPSYCIAWGIICIPFLLAGFFSIRKTIQEHRKVLLILAMAGAYSFVLSALKLPSVTGSSSHMTGTGLGAILFGPFAMTVLGFIVLIFQALLLAHGGISTLGANTFSMAVAGPILTYSVYRLLKKLKVPRYVVIFISAFLGDLFTYCITSLQLAIAYPSESGGIFSSFLKYLGIFAVTQIPLAVVEGFLTVIIILGLENYAKEELRELNYFKGGF